MSYLVDEEGFLAIKKVCVIGAGTMGSGIAAHLANLGFDVTLLDSTQQRVTEAFERARLARPPLFYVPERANEIRLGNVEEHLGLVEQADWVCEAIFENMEAKRALYAKIEPLLAPRAMISTNTSGLQIELLAEGFSDSFRSRFIGTHFFNPPRYLKLLELIPTPQTDDEVVRRMTAFLEARCGRRVVVAKDTPGFIANRFGMWSMFHAVHVAERLHLSVEEVDAITGPFLGRPRSASFRLNDIVGLDVMRDIAANLVARCPEDPYIETLQLPASTFNLLARGWIGEKAGHGYYRREGKELLALDLQTYAYRQRRDVRIPSLESLAKLPLGERLRQALELKDEAGEFLRHYLVPALKYADYLKEEISHNVLDFDRVLMWGFGWEAGPFEMIDAIGAEHLDLPDRKFYSEEQMRAFDGKWIDIPRQREFAKLTDFPVIGTGETYLLRDLDDGVTAISLSTKMGVINPGMVKELTELLASHGIDRYVLTSESRSFSAGYDLNVFAALIDEGRVADIDEVLFDLQKLGMLLERHRGVAAIFGHCLGAGLELALSCTHIVADSESQIGLPESRVGLIPGGRGATLMRLNNQYTAKRLAEVAITLTNGTISGSADQARVLGYLRPTDVTSYHPDGLLMMAKKVALTALPVERSEWKAVEGPLVGMIDRAQEPLRERGDLSEYDELIGDKIKAIFAKSATYEEALQKERIEFVDLCQRSLTHARIRHMLENNKPLRN